jgi:hypothetical protein
MQYLINQVSTRLTLQGLFVSEQEIKRAYWRGAKHGLTNLSNELQVYEIISYLHFNNISKPINQNLI